MSFVHLQVISAYSLLQSTTSIEKLVAKAKEDGYQAIALTDINVLYGIIDFYKACKKADIKPILGLTLEIAGLIQENQVYQMVFLAENLAGYQQLMKLSSLKMLKNSHEVLTMDDINSHLENLIVITPGEQGEIEQALLGEQWDKAQQIAKKWLTYVANSHFYLGVQVQSNLVPIIAQLQTLAAQLQIKTVAMTDVRYLEPSDHFSTKVLRAIDDGEKLALETEAITGAYYLPKPETVVAQFEQYQLEAEINETLQIAHRIQVEIPLNQALFPKYLLAAGETAADKLRSLCEAGLARRVPQATADYQERLNHELQVIHKMGFDDYFLIIWDVITFAHQNEIVTGAGRGSAAGSLVSYTLGITDVDPIQYQLLFERFLNVERFTMPDIDLDIPDNKREAVLSYVQQKYGANHVAQIATFGTLAAKMALRDVARVFGLNQNEANVWSNAIPKQLGITLSQAYQDSAKLRQLVQETEKNKLLFETAQKIEGLPRHVSTHAAGVVMTDQPLDSLVPLQHGGNEIYLTQFAMGNVEEIGLLKMDFLGLKNLSILANAMQFLKKDNQVAIQLNELPLDDEATLQLFRQGDTTGVFQFESSGIRNVLRKLGPTSIEDVAAVNALYRPGPMENIDLFIRRKKGLEPIAYPHDSLKDILGVTYGVMVYQEQIMQIAAKMAGFTLGQADILRRAISKKKKDVLDEERKHFIDGALSQGYTEESASEVYNWIERFANYGFNRSHAVAYSFIAYQLAYLKAHYPAAFFAALLNGMIHNPTKIKEYILEAKKKKVAIAPPDINQSFYGFSLKDHTIQFGLGSIKTLRRDFVMEIIQNRKTHGPYKDLIDFSRRMDPKWMKEENLRPLIFAGVFDHLNENRGTLISSLEGVLSSVKYSGNNMDLLGILEPKYEQMPDLTLEEKLEMEETYLGAYVSGHPIEQYQDLMKLKKASFVAELVTGKKATIIGFIRQIKKIRTKKGEQMAFVQLSDSSGDLSLTLFPGTYRRFVKLLEKNSILLVTGKVEENQQDGMQLLVDEIVDAMPLNQVVEGNQCFIKITKEKENPKVLSQLKEVLTLGTGELPVILFYESTNKKIALNQEDWIQPLVGVKEQLQQLLGAENIVIK
ncbi:DNA polymerase III subunit alpha [Isobaculum melis]|uniref:DNA polymerase III subunit alpha n=1 Tax=Isobaculum melis TaxID=142588 RepID=A0A1H9R8T9_9LACT|nr:DNA polymerase III subunit alpha [Isobaculum melis]SER68363.1 DNA polymerase III catalytic subunit, DnaE type [Isobaculum melis]